MYQLRKLYLMDLGGEEFGGHPFSARYDDAPARGRFRFWPEGAPMGRGPLRRSE